MIRSSQVITAGGNVISTYGQKFSFLPPARMIHCPNCGGERSTVGKCSYCQSEIVSTFDSNGGYSGLDPLLQREEVLYDEVWGDLSLPWTNEAPDPRKYTGNMGPG